MNRHWVHTQFVGKSCGCQSWLPRAGIGIKKRTSFECEEACLTLEVRHMWRAVRKAYYSGGHKKRDGERWQHLLRCENNKLLLEYFRIKDEIGAVSNKSRCTSRLARKNSSPARPPLSAFWRRAGGVCIKWCDHIRRVFLTRYRSEKHRGCTCQEEAPSKNAVRLRKNKNVDRPESKRR